MLCVSILNFERISHFILLLTFEQVNGPEKLRFQTINLFNSNYDKYIVLWTEKICFHVYSPNIRLRKERFLR